MSEATEHLVTLRQRQDYQFEIEFGGGRPNLLADEPPPLGQAAGPSPVQMLLGAVGDCMSSSLLFALRKFKNDPGGITTEARARVGRNEAGRLRVLHIDVHIRLGRPAAELQHLERILDQFEAFCTVGESVRAGIPTDIAVFDVDGTRLH
ncbi:MAG: OsmC family protein [Betaproteobacteria bacterium]|nr:OsmC family protein [Betaproteobacteria bacterium]